MGIFDSFKQKKPEGKSDYTVSQTPPKPKRATEGGWQVGGKINNLYEIRRILGGPGKSGMGIIYVCYVPEEKAVVALKTLQDMFLLDKTAVERFKWEAEAWVRLEKHCNIVKAKYVEVIQGKPYVGMEYIPGHEQYGADLSSWIYSGGLKQNGRPDIPLILNFSIQFCHGMLHAESKFKEMRKPFVHRDVKPSNIMVTQDKVVKVTDFGLVKAFSDMDSDIPLKVEAEGNQRKLHLTKSGNMCGTPPYMSPEQCMGKKDIDTRTDIYAFGCVLYEMLMQKPAFDGSTLEECVGMHLSYTPPPTRLNRELDMIIMKCLEKEKGKRYQNFKELEKELARIYRDITGKLVKQPQVTQLGYSELANKGVSLYNLGYIDESISWYKKALSVNPNYADAHINLGAAFYYKGQIDAAIAEYQEALRINPKDIVAHSNLGVAYKGKGQLDAAIAEYREALKINSNDAEVHYNLGIAYENKGQLDTAIAEYREALRINPNLAKAKNNLAVALKKRG